MFGRIENNIVDGVINQCLEFGYMPCNLEHNFFFLHLIIIIALERFDVENWNKSKPKVYIIFIIHNIEIVWKCVDKSCQKCWTSKMYWPMMVKQWTIGHCFTLHMTACEYYLKYSTPEANSGSKKCCAKLNKFFSHKSSSVESTSIKINAN